jgi:hypothetical protein
MCTSTKMFSVSGGDDTLSNGNSPNQRKGSGHFHLFPTIPGGYLVWVSREKAFLPALYIEECPHSLNKRLPIGWDGIGGGAYFWKCPTSSSAVLPDKLHPELFLRALAPSSTPIIEWIRLLFGRRILSGFPLSLLSSVPGGVHASAAGSGGAGAQTNRMDCLCRSKVVCVCVWLGFPLQVKKQGGGLLPFTWRK